MGFNLDIDFPAVLTYAVLVTAAIWLFDHFVLRPGREKAAGQIAGDTESAEAAREEVLAEPLLVEYARSFFPVLLIVLVLRSFLFEPYQIPSESMVPTLQVGDFILVNKYAYGLRLPVLGTKVMSVGDPQRGDVMVFVPPHDPRYFIKRVVGLPGDTIEYENKELRINGEPVLQIFEDEFPRLDSDNNLERVRQSLERLGEVDHLIYTSPGSRGGNRRWVVPEGHYFMMGDNRDRSDDSRRWGFVPDENVVGKAFAIWVHKDAGWQLPTFSRNRFIE